MNTPRWLPRTIAVLMVVVADVGDLVEEAQGAGGISPPDIVGAVVVLLGALLLALGPGGRDGGSA